MFLDPHSFLWFIEQQAGSTIPLEAAQEAPKFTQGWSAFKSETETHRQLHSPLISCSKLGVETSISELLKPLWPSSSDSWHPLMTYITLKMATEHRCCCLMLKMIGSFALLNNKSTQGLQLILFAGPFPKLEGLGPWSKSSHAQCALTFGANKLYKLDSPKNKGFSESFFTWCHQTDRHLYCRLANQRRVSPRLSSSPNWSPTPLTICKSTTEAKRQCPNSQKQTRTQGHSSPAVVANSRATASSRPLPMDTMKLKGVCCFWISWGHRP